MAADNGGRARTPANDEKGCTFSDEPAAGNVVVRRHDGIRAFQGPIFAQSPPLHVDIPQRIHVGSWVIDEEQGRGMNVEGFPLKLHCAVIYQVVDGKTVRSRMLI